MPPKVHSKRPPKWAPMHTPKSAKSAPGMPLIHPQKRAPEKRPQMNPCPRIPTNGVPRRPPKKQKWTPSEDPKLASEMAPKWVSEKAPFGPREKWTPINPPNMGPRRGL